MNKVLFETPRLLVRPFKLTDAEAVFALNSDARVTRFTGDAGKVTDLASAEHVIKHVWMAEYEKYGYGRFAIILKETQEVIGFTGLKYLKDFGEADLGYRMRPEFWGQGLGFEAAKATLKDAFNRLGLEKVIAMAMIENKASNRILARLNFENLGQREYMGSPVYFYQAQKRGEASV